MCGSSPDFVLSGVIATIGNMVAVWLTRRFLPFEIALLVGIAAAITISFTLSKLFAFRSRSWNRAIGEGARFLIVYATGCTMIGRWRFSSGRSWSHMAWQSKPLNQGVFLPARER